MEKNQKAMKKYLWMLALVLSVQKSTPTYANESSQVGPGYVTSIEADVALEEPTSSEIETTESVVEENELITELEVTNEELESEEIMESSEIVEQPEEIPERILYGQRGNRVAYRNSEAEYMTDEEILTWFLNYYKMNLVDFNPFIDDIIMETSKNNVFYASRYDVAREFYDLAQIPNEVKLATLMDYCKIDLNQVDAVSAAISKEERDDGNSYASSYLVANNLFSRTNSIEWQWGGNTIYQQITAKNQYEVVTKKIYLKNLGRFDLMSYQALLDRGYVEAMMGEYQLYPTPYLEFRSKSSKKGRQILPGDNKYRSLQAENDRLHTRPVYVPNEITFMAESDNEELYAENKEQVQTASLKLKKEHE